MALPIEPILAGAQPALPFPSRTAVDLRHLLIADVPDQGPRPLCVPFAVTAGHEALRTRSGTVQPLAPEALWWSCTSRGRTSAQGVQVSDIALALARTGQPALENWPYSQSLGSGTEDPPAGVGPEPWLTASLRMIPLAHDGTEDEIEDRLSQDMPVLVVVEVTHEFESPDAEGHIQTPSLTAGPGDYHAVLAVGAATHPTHGRRLLVRNSWGPYWGLGGYGWLPLEYLISFAVQACTVAMPSPSAPAPTVSAAQASVVAAAYHAASGVVE